MNTNPSDRRKLALAVALVAASLLAGCKRGEAEAAPPAAPHAEAPPTNRVDVPPAVRQNLGITFAKVERRRVASTLRVPGRFELLPTGRREHRATVPGTVKLLVNQYDAVTAGTPLYEVESPEWHKLRQQLNDAEATTARAAAQLSVAQRTRDEAAGAVTRTAKRVEELAGAQVRRAELEADLAKLKDSVPRLDAEVAAREVDLREAKRSMPIAVSAMAAALGTTPAELTAEVESPDGKVPRWRTVDRVTVRAAGPGVVEAVGAGPGAWVDAGAAVVTVVDPANVRFRAVGLQGDLDRLGDGLDVAVVPPHRSATSPATPIAGKLKIGLAADPDRRTVDLLVAVPTPPPAWARAGVSGYLEVFAEGSGSPELAVPAAAVMRDELNHVYFRRDPKDPDKVIRSEADLGQSDGKWVVLNSGVKVGDEVVVDGAYELKLAGGGKAGAGGGGHFHADGTWHAAGTPEKH